MNQMIRLYWILMEQYNNDDAFKGKYRSYILKTKKVMVD